MKFNLDQDRRWLIAFGDRAIVLPNPILGTLGNDKTKALVNHEGKPAVPVYILTPVGRQIASILPDNTENALALLASKIREQMRKCFVEIAYTEDGEWRKVKHLPEVDR